MKTAFKIYLRAQVAYALLTLPALLLWPMFVISEGLALSWGTAGLILLLPVIPLLRAARIRLRPTAVTLVWAAGMMATYTAVWLACRYYEPGKDPMDSMLEWWPYPAVAYVSATIGVLWERRRVADEICGTEPKTAPEPSGYGSPL